MKYKENCTRSSKGVEDKVLFVGEDVQAQKQRFIDIAIGFFTTRGVGSPANEDRANIMWFMRFVWEKLPHFQLIFGFQRREYFCSDIGVERVLTILVTEIHKFLFGGITVFYIISNTIDHNTIDEVLVPSTRGKQFLYMLFIMFFISMFMLVSV